MNPKLEAPRDLPLSARAHNIVRRLEAWVQEEIGAKRRLIELLEVQEAAMSDSDAETLVSATRSVSEAIQGEPTRAHTRHELLSALAREWGTSERALTLGGIGLRMGASGQRIARLRGELTQACEQALARGRRIALVAQAQRAVLNEMLNAIVGSKHEEQEGRGALLDAQA